MNSIVTIILSLIPFVVVGGWLVYKATKSKHSFLAKPGGSPQKIRVGDKNYIVRKKSRILAVEKKTGKEVIVTTCGFENEQTQLDEELKTLPEGVKIRYKLDNGIFSPEESDWLAGEDFSFSGVTQVEEYEQE
ncbi:hypothetical protein SAMN02745165_02415 [Malonomonas rubra DSM 5091]|uniref:Uncharacterized protein n=1 Tax=Malonomonas rubra DSM 5091 TaxID=1122189 RepID=A0A1M6JEA0_MALRU|nr:hypothetical protein SAMN02745165_02415 [Malonomonas rubra DSM 5091]